MNITHYSYFIFANKIYTHIKGFNKKIIEFDYLKSLVIVKQ